MTTIEIKKALKKIEKDCKEKNGYVHTDTFYERVKGLMELL